MKPQKVTYGIGTYHWNGLDRSGIIPTLIAETGKNGEFMRHIFLKTVLSMAAAVMAGCGGMVVNTPAPETPQPTAEPTAEATQAPQESASPYDLSVMKPWVNSTIYGLVTDEVNAELKDDFYLNVNHDWLKNAQLAPGSSSQFSYREAYVTVQDRCLELLKDSSLTGRDAELIQPYFQMYLDWDARNKAGLAEVMPFIEKLRNVRTAPEMRTLLASDQYHRYGAPFVRFSAVPYVEDTSIYMASVSAPALIMDDPAEYKALTDNGTREKKRREEEALYMMKRVGIDEAEAADIFEKAFAFETELASSMRSVLEKSNAPAKEFVNLITMDEILSDYPNIPLADIMSKRGWGKAEHINFREPKALAKLNELFTDEHIEGLRDHFLVLSLIRYISITDEAAFRKETEIVNESRGVTTVAPDEETAYRTVRDRFPDSFGRLYIEKYLNEGIRTEIRTICQDVVNTYREMLDEEEWLSPSTREAAKKKLASLKIRAVYPDKWKDTSMYHVTLKEEGGNYLSNTLDLELAEEQRKAGLVNEKVDPDIWSADILSTNAYYYPLENAIYIIPGFFCDATYRSDMSIEEKYGAIGNVIGHEISHAFDTNGSQYDETGALNNWWTDEDRDALKARSDKMIAYFDRMVAFDNGAQYQGRMVQAEETADLGGIKCMLRMARKIPDFDYKKYFEAYARLWQRVDTLQFCQYIAASDPHPLCYMRVNVSVQQFDEFFEAYGIKEGDGMYLAPEDRILIW